jgi:hypothetical protein
VTSHATVANNPMISHETAKEDGIVTKILTKSMSYNVLIFILQNERAGISEIL